MTGLGTYYSQRAAEYDAIYDRPERQRDLAALRDRVGRLLSGRRVLEIACGTGYWTSVIAPGASSVLATDASRPMLERAALRKHPPARVALQQADAYRLNDLGERRFDGCFAGFWWSHVPRSRWDAFLGGLATVLEPGARCVFVDNRFVPGSSTPLAETDQHGDTYQDRRLESGATFRILKNFPREGELVAGVGRHGERVELNESEHFWCLSFETRDPSGPPSR